jgi:arginase
MPQTTRRTWISSALIAAVATRLSRARAAPGAPALPLDLIEAPNNLGLRPPRPGVEPGTWRGPAALAAAGLSARLRPARHARLARPSYTAKPVPGTRIRNGVALRDFSLGLAAEVERSLRRGALPIVVGGDCSNLLGCLVALRRTGGRGLVHIDGHSDFSQLAGGDAAGTLGSAAGMDLALATGRGEPLLTAWPKLPAPLVEDADAIQIGEREDISEYPGLAEAAITRIPIHTVQAAGIARTAERVAGRLGERSLTRAWLHIDLDVLDQAVMPAVDSPGSPGLSYDELAGLVRALLRTGRIAGLDVGIFDPDLDPDGSHAARIVACLGAMLAPDGPRR